MPRVAREPLGRANERWSLHVLSDTLSSEHGFRCLTIIDEFSRECLATHAAHSIPAAQVIGVLERLRAERGLPEVMITDNGSEFTSRAFDAWAYARGVMIQYIQPGKPVRNCITRELQRNVARRVSESALVPLVERCATHDRGLAQRLPPGSAAQLP